MGTSQTADLLRLNAKSKRIAKSPRYKHRSSGPKVNKRFGTADISSLTDAELREVLLDPARRGRWPGGLPTETYKRMLRVLPPPLPTGGNIGNAKGSRWSQGTLAEATRVSKLRYRIQSRIEIMKLRAAGTSASSLPPLHVQDSRHGSGEHPLSSPSSSSTAQVGEAGSRSLDASGLRKDIGPSESTEPLKPRSKSTEAVKQPLDTTGWSRSDWINYVDSVDDAELRGTVLNRSSRGQRELLPMRIYERMLKVLPPPLRRGWGAKSSKAALTMARKVSDLRRALKALIRNVVNATDGHAPTLHAQHARPSPATERSSLSLLVDLAHQGSVTTPTKPHGKDSGGPVPPTIGPSPQPSSSASGIPVVTDKHAQMYINTFDKSSGSGPAALTPVDTPVKETHHFDLNITPPTSPQ